jgi:hypothetical protein
VKTEGEMSEKKPAAKLSRAERERMPTGAELEVITARRRTILKDRLTMIEGLAKQAHESMAYGCEEPIRGQTYLGAFDAIRGLTDAALGALEEENKWAAARQRRAS